jgi:small subunit ribosomal protein S3
LRAQIDFAVSEAKTTFGVIGIKVWIYTGDMIPSAENLRARSMARLSLGAAQEGQGNQSDEKSSGGSKSSKAPAGKKAGGSK